MDQAGSILNEHRSVNGYDLVDVLGAGGQFIAYRALKRGQEYCLRELEFGRRTSDLNAFKLWELVQREAAVLQDLDVEGVPRSYEFFEDDSDGLRFYHAQELMPGRNLKEIVEEEGPLSEEEALAITRDVLVILDELHNQGVPVVHRDVKPSNIMYERASKQVSLIDFGIVQQKFLQEEGGSTTFGSVGYSAPELLISGEGYPQTDLYSLGATLLYLCSAINADKLVQGIKLDYKERVEFENPSVEVFVDRLTEFEYTDRVESARDALEMLDKIKEGSALVKVEEEHGWLTRTLSKYFGDSILRYLIKTRKEDVDKERRRARVKFVEPQVLSFPGLREDQKYVIMETRIAYAQSIHELGKACEEEKNTVHPMFIQPDGSRVYRPLTFRENIRARVEHYESNTGDDRLELFKRRLYSCTGVAYEASTRKFKIIPVSPDLITLPQEFLQRNFPTEYDYFTSSVDYDSLASPELEGSDAIYSALLTKDEVLEHPAWLGILEGDRHLLKAYTDIVFAENLVDKQMPFYTKNRPTSNQLSSLVVGSLRNGSDVSGIFSLGSIGSFLRVAQREL